MLVYPSTMLEWPKLSKLGWHILIALAKRRMTRAELARALGVPLSRISEAVKPLKKGIFYPFSPRRPLQISGQIRENLLKVGRRYPGLEIPTVLKNSNAFVFYEISQRYETVDGLVWATKLSRATVKRALSILQKNLLVFQPKRGIYRLRKEMKPLAVLYQELLFSNVFWWREGETESKNLIDTELAFYGRVILARGRRKKLPHFTKTGLDLFSKYGIPLIGTEEHYFVNLRRAPSKEEVLVHALAFEHESPRNLQFCLLFIEKNKPNKKKALKLSKLFRVFEPAKSLFEYIKSKGEKRTPLLPSYEEFGRLREIYAK